MKALGGNGSAQNGSNLLSNQSQTQNILLNTLSNFDALGTIKGLIDRVSVRFALPYTQSSNIRQDCYEDTMDVLDAVKEMDKSQWAWARTIFDATGKLPSGVLKGKMSMLGSYDQCMENNVHISAHTVLGGRSKTSPRYPRSFKTTYCRATLTIPASILGNIDTKGVNPIATLGLCMPSTCNAKDVKNMLQLDFLACFSAEIHAPKILSGNSGHGAITCLHGIRFFSITWIMLGHTYNYGLITNPGVFTIENFVDAIPMIQRFTYQGVVGAGFSVDTFYMISGMLLSYIQIKQMFKLKKNPKPANVGYYVFYYYFHRFWRLTPMYMAVLLIFAGLFPYLGNGPMWPEGNGPAENCRQNWWTNLLYVNNLVKVDGMCMGWSWFLANDMQFYVVSIVLLFFLTLNLALGSLIIFLLLAAGIASAGWKEHIYNGSFFTMRSDGGAFWNNVYITPWCRVAAFCVGMLLGVIMYRKPKYSIGRARAFVGWCLAIAFGLGLVYCTYSENKKGGEPWSRDFRAAYESLGRPLWAACVAWVVFACHHGYGGKNNKMLSSLIEQYKMMMSGIVDSLLSWKGLVPLSRLSYAAYLVHPILMMVHVYSKRNLVYLNDYEIIYLFLGHTVLTFMTAFVVSLLFEAPFMALEKLFIGKRR
ncbi:hypothetical protein FSP39_011136 [Pinctada imbricata]|uniref:Nose resistant-to-fluoxetine protein N-terminal domain-containing protein n=1 Tax=Pinctada imbricata TaxID=66713 RepID=A0AA88YNN8_PINIB|nr:hypothetical protein FSP39_011136 [Pinctada imbricata]